MKIFFSEICFQLSNVLNLQTNVIIMSKLVANSDIQIDKAVRSFVNKVEKESNLSVVDKDLTYKKFLSSKLLIVHSIMRPVVALGYCATVPAAPTASALIIP